MADKEKVLVVNDKIADVLTRQVMDDEVSISEGNRSEDNDEFELCMSLLDAERGDRQYEWMSDIRIPEFVSHMLTQASIDAGQYFTTRDFVEVYIEDEGDEAKAAADAAKELINRTLNRKDLYHYQKFIRAKTITNVVGRVYAKCAWEQQTIYDIVDYQEEVEEVDVDIYGNPLVYADQTPALRRKIVPVYGEVPLVDRFTYDVWDQRNVFIDNSYTYSLQEKRWIIFRSEMTLSELMASKDQNGYFNLDKLKDIKPPETTEFKSQAANKLKEDTPVSSSIEHPFDIYERYGKFWCVVDRDENGMLVYGSERPGIGDDGKPLDKAEMHHVIITVAVSGGHNTLIGFKLTPFVDAEGKPYMPVIRGLCYIHPTEDGGVGDGKYAKELQIAIDDTFNISQDRVMLATLPTIAADESAMEDNTTLFFEPAHVMKFRGSPKDNIHEFKISDNIVGALQQINLLTAKMQQVDSIQPPSMGDTGNASTTATAFAGASRDTGERANYKSLTFENTFLCDLYWMIQQMTFRFAKPETGIKLMGEKVYDFRPMLDYFYKPLSQSIEPEHSKQNKRKDWQTIIGYLVNLVQVRPDAIELLNYALAEFVKLMGDEYANFANKKLNPKVANLPQGSQAGGAPQAQIAGPAGMGPSNQNGMPMSGMEQSARATESPVAMV